MHPNNSGRWMIFCEGINVETAQVQRKFYLNWHNGSIQTKREKIADDACHLHRVKKDVCLCTFVDTMGMKG